MLLQFGIPGAIELIVIVLIAIVVFGVPLVLIAVVGALWLRGGDEYDERIRELETEIARLQAQVGDSSGAGSESAGPEGVDSEGVRPEADTADSTTDTGADKATTDGRADDAATDGNIDASR